MEELTGEGKGSLALEGEKRKDGNTELKCLCRLRCSSLSLGSENLQLWRIYFLPVSGRGRGE